jgi:hypothetical protein
MRFSPEEKGVDEVKVNTSRAADEVLQGAVHLHPSDAQSYNFSRMDIRWAINHAITEQHSLTIYLSLPSTIGGGVLAYDTGLKAITVIR